MTDWTTRTHIFAGFGASGMVITVPSLALLRSTLLDDYVVPTIRRRRLNRSGRSLAKAEIDRVMIQYKKLIAPRPHRRFFNANKSEQTPCRQSFTRVIRLCWEGKWKGALSLIGTYLIPLRNAYLWTAAAEGLYSLALALEQAGTDGQLDRCRQLLPRAFDEFDRFRNTLELAGWV